tara:strand:- start:36 stop:269 length:234 start_codon:yes stop_codon:yes gene_type:complete
MEYDGTHLYLRLDKSVKITADGSTFAVWAQILDHRELQYIAPKLTSNNTEIGIAMSKGLFKLPAGAIPVSPNTSFPI